MRPPPIPLLLAVIGVLVPRAWLPGRRRRTPSHAGELRRYRADLGQRTARIDAVLKSVADTIDALRRRETEVDVAEGRFDAAEAELEVAADEFRELMAPEELHSLHFEYDANLERALRGLVTAERGCALTRLPHRPLEDEEVMTYWKRGAANVVHARLRMQEIAEVLLKWEPGKPAEVSVSTRLDRE